MKNLLSTREVAQFLGVNEKMVYALISDKGLPATKVTGKWLFPAHLVEQWVENSTINFPRKGDAAPQADGLLLIAGSNDILFERTLKLFMDSQPDYIAAFANMGSMGGIKALRRGVCHMATSHLKQEESSDYNFAHAERELEERPAVVNFCLREQGLLVPKGNPAGISKVEDIARSGLTVANRPLGTGTRLLFDSELAKAGIDPARLKGYDNEFSRHMDVGLEVLSGRADAAPAIRAVAGLLGLDFISLGWERFDLLIPRATFFERPIQLFMGLFTTPEFARLVTNLQGYDTSKAGRVVFPGDDIRS
ncbi:substrate-binding domain-containing protein [Oleidesulfovibrio sp.]|uniref:substrate-binding domain-containing protein n=1 Tax=Oleidesulfovibrio sp. TaxID=2909707 RepID=UPI003A8C2524